MALVQVGKLSRLPADSAMEVEVGERTLAVCNVGGAVTAIDGLCPHRGGPLGQGQIQDGRLVCPWHLWDFDCRTGAYGLKPNEKLATYSVRIEGDDILIDIPPVA